MLLFLWLLHALIDDCYFLFWISIIVSLFVVASCCCCSFKLFIYNIIYIYIHYIVDIVIVFTFHTRLQINYICQHIIQ